MLARHLMTADVVTVQPDDSLRRAAGLLTQNGFTALPVVDSERALVGIITEEDLIRARFDVDALTVPSAGAAPQVMSAEVGSVMTTPVVAVSDDADVSTVVQEMLAQHRRCVPIVDGGRLVGVITRRDVIRALQRTDESIARDVRRHLLALGGADRWEVRVVGGDVELRDRSFTEAGDHSIAVVLAEAVPGVVHVGIVDP